MEPTRALHALRPCVPAISVREAACSFRLVTADLGRPDTRVFQVEPPFVVWKTPTSFATYSVLAMAGSTTMSLTGECGRLPVMFVQLAPPLMVLYTYPRPSPPPPPTWSKPEKV